MDPAEHILYFYQMLEAEPASETWLFNKNEMI
jgi:hypothetical protein